MKPYYEDDLVTFYLGDQVGVDLPSADAVITDPPYGDETSLEWDRWPEGWPSRAAGLAPQLWSFGSMRMFLKRRDEFECWRFGQEVVWEKHNGSGFHADRFRRVHEFAAHWYQGSWESLYKAVPTTPGAVKKTVRRKERPAHMGEIAGSTYTSVDGGDLLMRSVIKVRSEHGRAVHPTQKPIGIVAPLIEYSVPPGGLVIDLFAGSGTTLLAARMLGRRAIGCEISEKYAEAAAKRLSQQEFVLEVTA